MEGRSARRGPACPVSPLPQPSFLRGKVVLFFFLIFPRPDAANPTKTFDWSRDYMLRFQPLSASGVNFLPELK